MEENTKNIDGKGKVHKLVRADIFTGSLLGKNEGRPSFGIYAPWCNRGHDIDSKEGIKSDWPLEWTRTNEPITCGTCLKVYLSNGCKRPPKTIIEVTVDELKANIQREKPRGNGAVIIASSPSKRFAILSIYTDDDKNLCIDVEGV